MTIHVVWTVDSPLRRKQNSPRGSARWYTTSVHVILRHAKNYQLYKEACKEGGLNKNTLQRTWIRRPHMVNVLTTYGGILDIGPRYSPAHKVETKLNEMAHTACGISNYHGMCNTLIIAKSLPSRRCRWLML